MSTAIKRWALGLLFAAFIAQEVPKYARIVKASGAKVD